MTFKIKGKEVEIKYTFNSFRFIKDFDISVVETLDAKPFLTIDVVEKLLLGGLNSSPKKVYSLTQIDEALEEFVEEGDLVELLTGLMDEIQGSPFFKSLQRSAEKK